jgi:hypothetical protein
MRTGTKSAFLLLAALALGIVIGILVSGALSNRRMQRLAELRTGPGLTYFMERAVQPESDEQRRRIREILDRAAPRFAEVFDRTHEETRSLSDSVMLELSSVLTEEQMQELRSHLQMRRRPPPGEPGRRGPPGTWRRRPAPSGEDSAGQDSAAHPTPPPPE